jgi:hypothetical protein
MFDRTLEPPSVTSIAIFGALLRSPPAEVNTDEYVRDIADWVFVVPPRGSLSDADKALMTWNNNRYKL